VGRAGRSTRTSIFRTKSSADRPEPPLGRIFFSALAQGLQAPANDGDDRTISGSRWCTALSSALARLYAYTRARAPCSRTLVDPLAAFVEALPGRGLGGGVRGAAGAAEGTRDVRATAGRSAYVEGARLAEERVPDPGAWGVKVILEALVDVQ
jgi:dihydroxyacetone kinase